MPQSALCSLPSALAAGVCAASLLSGCDVTIKDGDIKDVSIRAKATQEWSRTYSLTDGGRVEVINSHGPIEVSAGPAGVVGIAAVIEVQGMTDQLARETLKEVSLEESSKPDHVRVATVGPRSRGGVDVRLTVTLPADARLEMTGNNGRLKADGLRGHVKAMVVNGGVELTAMRGTIDAAGVNASVSAKMAEVTGPVRLESTNGRIVLEIPRTAKATLNARSVNGNIAVTGLTIAEGTGRRIRTLESQVNGGGPEIDLRATNGRISIEGK
jgi:Putative adhesin